MMLDAQGVNDRHRPERASGITPVGQFPYPPATGVSPSLKPPRLISASEDRRAAPLSRPDLHGHLRPILALVLNVEWSDRLTLRWSLGALHLAGVQAPLPQELVMTGHVHDGGVEDDHRGDPR